VKAKPSAFALEIISVKKTRPHQVPWSRSVQVQGQGQVFEIRGHHKRDSACTELRQVTAGNKREALYFTKEDAKRFDAILEDRSSRFMMLQFRPGVIASYLKLPPKFEVID
jgi:hypothetical protein